MDTASNSIDKAIVISGVTAAIISTGLILSQNDRISRFILSPVRLRIKRRQEQLYMLNKAIAKSIIFVRRYINGGEFYDWQEEKKITDLVLRDGEIKELANDIVVDVVDVVGEGNVDPTVNTDETTTSNYFAQTEKTPLICGISKDLTIDKASEFYIHLAFPEKSQDGNRLAYARRVQVPLEKFGTYLASAFGNEKKELCNNLCFVADASSSLGTHTIGQIVEHSQCQIPVIHEPAWMYTLAFLIQKKALPIKSLENILYGLCKLSAQAVAHEVGNKYKTIVFTLPGQACTAQLLPLLQRLFPSERHIFAYDGCVSSVERAMGLPPSKDHYADKKKRDISVTTSYTILPVTSMPRDVTSSTPITPQSLTGFTKQVATLSSKEASIVETWMSSVNSFLSLKKEEEAKEVKGYIPYVCKMGSLFKDGNANGNGNTNDNSSKKDSSSTSFALIQLLEYITGTSEATEAAVLQSKKSSSKSLLSENELDAATSVLTDLQTNYANNHQAKKVILKHERRVAIEDCASFIKEGLEFKGI
jgi:hypothetical protein